MIEDLRGYNHWTPGGVEPGQGGVKYDTGKVPLSLISRRAQEEEAKVLSFGAKKYAAWNWAEGMKWSRLLDAALRHITAYADGENTDAETGLSHLAHARCCLGFLLDYERSHPEHDDRRRRTSLPVVRKPDDTNTLQAGVQTQLPLFPKL